MRREILGRSLICTGYCVRQYWTWRRGCVGGYSETVPALPISTLVSLKSAADLYQLLPGSSVIFVSTRRGLAVPDKAYGMRSKTE